MGVNEEEAVINENAAAEADEPALAEVAADESDTEDEDEIGD